MNKVVLYCRAGFEKECAAELIEKITKYNISGEPRIKENSAYVIFDCYQEHDAERLIKSLSLHDLIFTRQMFVAGALLKDLSNQDRITPIVELLLGKIGKSGQLRVEVPDTNVGKDLLKFCRKFTVPLRNSLRREGILTFNENYNKPVIHVFFIAPGCCYVGYSYPQNSSPFYMGIPRLKLPKDAPSRSTLKLEEAFHLFIPKDEWEERLAGGMHAVDLGASPGGWTYQLVRHNMMVQAVDNGVIEQTLLDTGQVVHWRSDGFKFVPKKKQVNWMVCDMVEKPSRITELAIKWLINGWCRETIFNLKLPMKKRYQEVEKNLQYLRVQLEQAGINAEIQAKHLYHDREEVTVHVRRVWGAIPLSRLSSR